MNSSNDSGLPEDKSSSKSSSVNSSMSTLSNGSPRNQEQTCKTNDKTAKSHKHEVVIKIDGKPAKTKSSAGGKDNSAALSKVGAKLEHSLSTQQIEDKYLDTLPHSNSTSALSAMAGIEEADQQMGDNNRNSGLKSKRKTNFSNVRENTGFMKVDNTSSSQKTGLSSSVTRKSIDSGHSNPSSLNGTGRNSNVSANEDFTSRQSQTNGSSSATSTSIAGRSNNISANKDSVGRQGQTSANSYANSAGGVGRSGNVSNSKDFSKQGHVSAKLRTAAQDNATKLNAKQSSADDVMKVPPNSNSAADGTKDVKTVQKSSATNSVIKPTSSVGSPAKSTPKGTSELKASASQSISSRPQQNAPVSKTGNRSQQSNKSIDDTVSRTRTNQQTTARQDSSNGKVSGVASTSGNNNTQPQVMQLKSNITKDNKDRSNLNTSQNKTGNSSSISASQPKMANTSVRTPHIPSSKERGQPTSSSQMTKVIHVQEAVDSSPKPNASETGGNRNTSGSNSHPSVSSGNSGINTKTGAASRSVSNTGQHRHQTSGPITSGGRSNPTSRSVSSNARMSRPAGVTGSSTSQSSVSGSKQTADIPAKAGSSESVASSQVTSDKSGKTESSNVKSTVLSGGKDRESGTNRPNSGKTSKSVAKDTRNLSKPKSNYTTTMTVKLTDNSNNKQTVPQAVQSGVCKNAQSDAKDSTKKGDVSPEIFNRGEAPVAPPRRKRSTGSRPTSTSSCSSNGSLSPPAEFGENFVVSKTGVLTSLSVNTLKHGVTPVSSATIPSATGISTANKDNTETKKSPPARPPLPVTKQVAVKTGDSLINVKLSNNKDISEKGRKDASEMNEDHTGPTIVDPFESLNERRMKEFQEMMAKEREAAEKRDQPPRSGKSRANVGTKKTDVKGKTERQGSAGKGRRTRQKANAGGEESKKRPKSSKKKKKGKKKEGEGNTALSDNVEDANVALIGGIGWHIETGCNDKTDVQAVTLKDSSDEVSDDSEEDEINITLHPGFLQGASEGESSSQGCQRELTILVSGTIPGQVSDSDNSESDFEDIPEHVEIVHDEVNYVFGEGYSSRSMLNTGRTAKDSVRKSREFKSNIDKVPARVEKNKGEMLPQTSSALDKFDSQVSEAELNDILGSKFPEIYGKQKNSQAASSVNSNKQAVSARIGRASNQDRKTKMRRNNSMPAERKEATPRIRPRARHPSISESIDPETDEMIAEILKSTPNPSLSLGSVKNSGSRKTTERGMSREEFEDIMNNGGQKSFREVQGSSEKRQGKLKADCIC